MTSDFEKLRISEGTTAKKMQFKLITNVVNDTDEIGIDRAIILWFPLPYIQNIFKSEEYDGIAFYFESS